MQDDDYYVFSVQNQPLHILKSIQNHYSATDINYEQIYRNCAVCGKSTKIDLVHVQ